MNALPTPVGIAHDEGTAEVAQDTRAAPELTGTADALDAACERPRDASWVHDAWRPPSRTTSSLSRFFTRRVRPVIENERGAVTAEYAIVIMAAVAFAGLLVAIMRSGEIRGMLVQLVESALSAAG